MKKSFLKKTIFTLGLLSLLLLILTCHLVRAQVKPGSDSVKTVKYTSQDLRDPFENPFEMMTQPEPSKPTIGVGLSHLQVQGVIWGSKMPQAIINNVVVRIGEVIEGVEILDIRQEGVYVLYEGRQYIIRPVLGRD
ncbi:MAG: hypothetical protein ISS45_01990 [Candidatus Omnitrophica bacterium]|nr:hypothetical protein [Candidatus Omnitrophota bacterium]